MLAIALGLFVASCEEKAVSPTVPQGPDFSVTPMENEEAELAAYYLTKSLIAPIPVYNRIRDDLALIRKVWQDSIEQVNIKFRAPYGPSLLIIWVNPSTYDSMKAGDYHHWDSLNAYYRLDSVSFRWRHADHAEIILRFQGRLNSQILLYNYSGLPGFQYITLAPTTVGDNPNLYIYKKGSSLKYFFRNGYDDCPVGCLSAEYFYFTIENGEARLIDKYFRIYPYNDLNPIPPWADTVRQLMTEYGEIDLWYADDFVL
jgi:hypothetical protein